MVHFSDKQVWESQGDSQLPRPRNSSVGRAWIIPNLYQQFELCWLCEHKLHSTTTGSADLSTEIEGHSQNGI